MKHYLQIIDSFIFASHHYFFICELKQKYWTSQTRAMSSLNCWNFLEEKIIAVELKYIIHLYILAGLKSYLMSSKLYTFCVLFYTECDADCGLCMRFCSWSICMVMKSGESESQWSGWKSADLCGNQNSKLSGAGRWERTLACGLLAWGNVQIASAYVAVHYIHRLKFTHYCW